MKKAVVGMLFAGAVALTLANVSIGGVAVWKIALAVLGFLVFAMGGRSATGRRS